MFRRFSGIFLPQQDKLILDRPNRAKSLQRPPIYAILKSLEKNRCRNTAGSRRSMDQFVNQIIGASGGIKPELVIFFISLLPLLELRGGILAAGMLKVEIVPAFFICFFGTLLPIPFILLFFRKIMRSLRGTRFGRLADRITARMEKKSRQIEKYRTGGLLLFVAVPLPGTGAWTGAMLAAFMGMRFRHALFSIAVGSLIADAIMCAISYGALGWIW